MNSPPWVQSDISSLQTLSPEESISKYSPSIGQIGQYLIQTPGTNIDPNIVRSLEFILTNLHVALLEHPEEVDLEALVGKTRFVVSSLVSVLNSNPSPDATYYKNLIKVGKNLRNIDAQAKRFP